MFIYKITNITNQKCYVGSTKRSLKKRFKAHLYEARKNVDDMYLHRAMRKYGEINFQIELIEECVIETLYDREIYWIKKLNTKSPNGYNLHDGGRGGCLNPSDELRQKLSDAKKGRIPWNKGLSRKQMENYIYNNKMQKINKQKNFKLKKEIKTKSCLNCSKQFEFKYNDKKYCSTKCSNQHRSRQLYIRKDNKQKEYIFLICPRCNITFSIVKTKYQRKFCSRSCANSINAKKVKINGMKKIEVKEKFSKQITGRKRKYKDDGKWFWSYKKERHF